MKKAVLIIDLPENCRDCPFFGYECRLTRNRCNWYNEDGRHETCPLQELPGPMEVCGRYPQPGTVPSYRIGWNACLDKITEDLKEEKVMKATGIVRRVDDLGRIVIPKNVRTEQGITEGTPMEIFTEDGAVIFKKYATYLEEE